MKKINVFLLSIFLSFTLINCGKNGNNGSNGLNGKDGSNGINGHSAVFSTASASETQCSNGGTIFMIGIDTNDNQTLDTFDTNIQTMIVCNGLDGEKGEKGNKGDKGDTGNTSPPTQFTPIAIIDPCGDASGIYDEVFLKLYDGSILASFSDTVDGKNTRFVLLKNGTYQTTDGDNCVFTLMNGAITHENHHY